MKRKDYEKPTMQVVLFKQHAQLLVGSMGDRDNYDPTDSNPFAG